MLFLICYLLGLKTNMLGPSRLKYYAYCIYIKRNSIFSKNDTINSLYCRQIQIIMGKFLENGLFFSWNKARKIFYLLLFKFLYNGQITVFSVKWLRHLLYKMCHVSSRILSSKLTLEKKIFSLEKIMIIFILNWMHCCIASSTYWCIFDRCKL